MGFYSFYKIIKDIISCIFGRKTFRFLLIILLFILIAFSVSEVFAFDVNIEDKFYSLPNGFEDYKYHLFIRSYKDTDVRYLVIYSNEPMYLLNDLVNSFGCDIPFYYYSLYPGYGDNFPDGNLSNVDLYYEDFYVNIEHCYYITHQTMYTVEDFTFQYWSDYDVKYREDGSVFLPDTGDPTPVEKNPYFITTQEDLSNGNIEKLVISSGDMNVSGNNEFYLQSYYYPEGVSEEESYDSLFPRKEILLNGTMSPYFVGANQDGEYLYEIPRADLGIDLTEGNKYAFVLATRDTGGYYTRLERLAFTVGTVNPDDVTNDKLDQQTDAINEQTNTIKDTSDKIFSDEYDEDKIQIDSGLSDGVDGSNYTNFITDIINAIKDAVTGNWETVEEVTLPIPFTEESITLQSNLVSKYVPNALKIIINVFWMYLFGMYIFKFALAMVSSLKSGEILEGKLNLNDEVITSSML